MASVRRRDPKDPDSPWIVEYTDAAGKRRRKTPKTGLKKDADKIRQQIERELQDGTHVAVSQTATVGDVVKEFLVTQQARVRDGAMGKARLQVLSRSLEISIIRHVGAMKLTDITPLLVEDLYHKLRKGDRLAAVTAKDRLFNFKLVERFARKRGYLKSSPVTEALQELRSIPKKKVRTFTQDQIVDLLRAAEIVRPYSKGERGTLMLKIIVHIAVFCGLRYGEILGLTLANVDADGRVLKVRHSLSEYDGLKGPKTKAGVRDVPMPLHVAYLLQSWRERFYVPNEQQLIFRTVTGGSLRTSSFHNQMWKPLLKRAGLASDDAFHFHALRHFAASMMIDRGISMPDVAVQLGHSAFDITLQVYAHQIVSGGRGHAYVDAVAGELLSARPVIDATKTRLLETSH